MNHDIKGETPEFTQSLLNWYYQHARDLPWRRTRDPYAIWVSEVMLQQTQVDTVIPFYHRFMEYFPTVAVLAAAPEENVMKAWEGLGYYRRARLLHQGAKEVLTKHQGIIPEDSKALAALPGIGPYILGAVSSIAFNRPVAAVDGNVIRVVSRILALEEDVAALRVRRQITAWVQARFPAGAAGDYTQALMELGALICLPKRPRCPECPVAGLCRGVQTDPARFPVKTPKRRIPEEQRVVMLIQWERRRLLRQRPATGLMAGFWEYPHFILGPNGDGAAQAGAWAKEHLGIELSFRFCRKMIHVYSHLRWNLELFEACWRENDLPPVPPDSAWLLPEEAKGLSRVAFVREVDSEK